MGRGPDLHPVGEYRLTALEATLAAGCDDLHECASTDCCPLPFVELAAGGVPR